MATKEICPVNLQERERNLDWLTALVPVLLLGLVYFRWQVLALAVVGAAAYMAVAALIDRRELMFRRVEGGLVTGVLVTLCLPATAPVWTAALACAVAALLVAGIDFGGRRFGFATAPLCPALAGYLLVRYLFPAAVSTYPMPAMWASVDATTGATPLAALSDPSAQEPMHRMLAGIHPSAIGEGCGLVLVLAALYLLLRRRLRLIAPAVMLGTVCLLSQVLWSAPWYGLLSGGVLLAALILADRAYAPASWWAQILCGLTAGGVTVLMRHATGTDGSAVGVLAACLVGFVWWLVARWIAPLRGANKENFTKTEKKG